MKELRRRLERSDRRWRSPAAAGRSVTLEAATPRTAAGRSRPHPGQRAARHGTASRERLIERIDRLTAALKRVEEGTYGTCIECDKPIAPARLRAIPEVATCVSCQEKLERGGSE
jgi:DnaK suppressor protein